MCFAAREASVRRMKKRKKGRKEARENFLPKKERAGKRESENRRR